MLSSHKDALSFSATKVLLPFDCSAVISLCFLLYMISVSYVYHEYLILTSSSTPHQLPFLPSIYIHHPQQQQNQNWIIHSIFLWMDIHYLSEIPNDTDLSLVEVIDHFNTLSYIENWILFHLKNSISVIPTLNKYINVSIMTLYSSSSFFDFVPLQKTHTHKHAHIIPLSLSLSLTPIPSKHA